MAKDPNSEAAKKVADAEKASKKKAGKSGPNIFVRMGKAIAKFFKDLKGETKKIVWPNAKSVLKNTGIVIAVVLIIGIGIWVVDWGLSAGIDAILGINTSSSEEVSEESSEADTTVAAVETTVAPSTAADDTTAAATEAESQAE